MKSRKLFLVISMSIAVLILLSAFVFSAPKSEVNGSLMPEYLEENCSAILVGKDASFDGSTMATHTCDCGVCDFTWRHVPAADHVPGDVRKIYAISQYETWASEVGPKWEMVYKEKYTGVEIPQVPHTYAYHHAMFGYINEKQVCIGESTFGGRREMSSPNATMNLTELTLIAMERAKTAREAIQIMGDLTTEYGYGLDSGEMLAVHDPEEAWIFEIMPVGPLWTPDSGKLGAIWCAQRVPDDHVSLCPNDARIGEIDLENKDYFMASENVISYAIEHDYYDPDSEEAFNWKKAYSPDFWSARSSGGRNARLWRFYDIVAPSLKLDPDTLTTELPFSVKPEKRLSVADVMDIVRDHYEGTEFDLTTGVASGPFGCPTRCRPLTWEYEGEKYSNERPLGSLHCEYATVTQARSWLPDPIGGICWVSLGVTETAAFVPFYAGMNELPASYHIGDHWVFDRNVARWAFDYVDMLTQVKYSYAIQDVNEAIFKWEGGALSRTSAIDKEAYELYLEDPAKAREFLTKYCIDNANQVVDAWWNLGDNLLVKYDHGFVYKPGRKQVSVGYPDEWKKLIIEIDGKQPIYEKK